MSNTPKSIFDMQTKILLNHVLISLIKVFFNLTNGEHYLYSTIIPIKEITKKDFIRANKSIPHLLKYELWIKISDNKMYFVLKNANFREFQMFNIILTNPNIRTLKNITTFLVTNYRPLPTKVDKRFAQLATKHSEYLEYFGMRKRWNNGISKNEKLSKTFIKLTEEEINSLYEDFSFEVRLLLQEYRAMTKLLLDLYQKKFKVTYLSSDRTYELATFYSSQYGISIYANSLVDNYITHEIISLNEFHPTIDKISTTVYKAILSCLPVNSATV